jgi:hypothetical protein
LKIKGARNCYTVARDRNEWTSIKLRCHLTAVLEEEEKKLSGPKGACKERMDIT